MSQEDIEPPEDKGTQAGRLRSLAGNSIIYGLSFAISRMITFIALPVLTAFFSPEEYSLIDFFTVFSIFAGTIFAFGQDVAVSRLFYEFEEHTEKQRIITESLIVRFMFAAVFTAVLYIGVEIYNRVEGENPRINTLIMLAVGQSVAMIIYQYAATITKLVFEKWRFVTLTAGSTFGFFFFLLIYLIYFELGLYAIFIAAITSYSLFSLLGLFFIRRWLLPVHAFQYLKPMLLLAAPFGVISIIFQIVALSERGIIAATFGAEQLGIYAASMRLALGMILVNQAFEMAWQPFWLSIYKEKDAAQTYDLVLKVFTLFMIVALAGMSVIAFPALALLTPAEYHPGVIVILPLCMAYAVQGVGWILEIGIVLSKRSGLQLYVSAVYLIGMLLGIYVGAQLFGLVGVAAGVVFGHLAKSVVSATLAQRAYPLTWRLNKIAIVGLLLSLWVAVWVVAHSHFDPLRISIGSALMSPLLIAFCAMVLFTRKDVGAAWKMVLRAIGKRPSSIK